MKSRNLILILILLYVSFSNSSAKDILGMSLVDLNGVGSDVMETVLGNLVADVMRDEGCAEISFINAASIGLGIEKREIREEDISKLLLSGEDTIVILELKGSQIKNMLERSIKLYPKESKNFLQVSGISFKFNKDEKPGERIVEVNLVSNSGIFALEDEKVYKVATTRFLALGTIGFYKIFNEKNILKDTKIKLKEALTKYIYKRVLIEPEIEGRITLYEEQE